MFRSKEPVGSGCIAQVYRGWARVDQVEDPAFQLIVEEMEKEDLLEAWEIPGLGGMASTLRQLWRGSSDEEGSKERSNLDGQHEEHMIPVAIKVSLARYRSPTTFIGCKQSRFCIIFLACFVGVHKLFLVCGRWSIQESGDKWR